MSEWKPIESAPKDGTHIDLWAGDERIADAAWVEPKGWCEWALGGFESMEWCRLEVSPTHWMPLPPPPVKGE